MHRADSQKKKKETNDTGHRQWFHYYHVYTPDDETTL